MRRIILISFLLLLLIGCTKKEDVWGKYHIDRFTLNDREAIVVVPNVAEEGKPWIWRPAFFGAFPSVDLALLEKGFHVVYYDLTHLYGSPRSLDLGSEYYNYIREHYSLSGKVTLEGFSRGGLFVFNWAAQNPDKVACIYVDAPVCDVFSWPGRKDKVLWNDFLNEWKITDEEADNFKGNPIDNLDPIAKANISIMAVCGDSDDIVPYEENMGVVYERYKALNGKVELIMKEGVGHHPHSLDDPKPVVDFIIENQ